MMAFSKQSEGMPMQTINLKQYYPFCKEDIFVEVSDEIVEAFLLDKRAEAARDRKMFRYKAFYSLDCNDGIEKCRHQLGAAIAGGLPDRKRRVSQKQRTDTAIVEKPFPPCRLCRLAVSYARPICWV